MITEINGLQKPYGEKSGEKLYSGRKSNVELSSGEKSNAGLSSGGKSNVELSSGEKSNAGLSSGGKSNVELSSGEKSNAGLSSGGKSNVELSSGEKSNAKLRSRVKGALIGLAYGDAFGMPVEMWTPEQIRNRVGYVDCFLPGQQGNPISEKLRRGEVTDDTINSIFVIQMLAENGGQTDARLFLRKLKAWIQTAEKSSAVVGPSTRRAMDLLEQGVPMEKTGTTGTTNGGAMKILPVGLAAGIRACKAAADALRACGGDGMQLSGAADSKAKTLCPVLDEDQLIAEVERLCMPTHYTGTAISGAAAIAAGGAAAVCGGNDPDEIFLAMLRAARKGERSGNQLCGPSVAARMQLGRRFTEDYSEKEALDLIYQCIGTGLPAAESVPAAAAIFCLSAGDPHRCAEYAANLGGDTDTIGAMACGICGAFSGFEVFDNEEIRLLEEVNAISFDSLTDMLMGCVL